ncbi:glycosyltransferase family 2 protein [Phycicoccus sp. HDW14]|uniref:glycosyltransferase family 2 protein n=1 Tax=Phycicoccus sp. HDW14 TaxID=2714941 RepID=UPI001409242D|nr:glycosyltransferase family 2 protein [Phycicoccus sp. HDW14]QIM21556.1 glycosyltransferase family 2 protein [Phycicoccus sp. HDW14]
MAEVTVAISFCDNAGTLLDCVRSVYAQTVTDWRLLLVDDGSVDGGGDLVAALDDPRVELFRHRENRGTPVRLNEISQRVSTPLLARMDGDDLMHPRRLELSLAALAEGADLVAGAAVSVDGDTRPSGLRPSVATSDPLAHLRHAPLVHASVTGRTQWFLEHPYDASLRRCQDQELWVRTLGDRDTVVLDDVVLYLREAGTVPAAKYARSMAGTRAVVRRHGPVLVGRGRAARMSALTVAKEVAYRVAEPLGLVDRLVGRRSATLGPADLVAHAEVLEAIRSVRLPGVDPA